LAPIFAKTSTKHQHQQKKKSAPVLTEAERQALEERRAFLTSGVPEELKRQKLSVFVPVSDSSVTVVWPTDSHVQQKPSTAVEALGSCDPWTLQSCEFSCRELATGVISTPDQLTLCSIADVLENTVVNKIEVCLFGRNFLL